MKQRPLIAFVAGLALILGGASFALGPQNQPQVIALRGLERSVEIIRDKWGIAHISAQNESDLFFAQGFNVASDRLFQLELWRRQATGTTAEWLGAKAIPRDTGARLFRFRGDLEKELSYYHPRSKEIIRSFIKGINAYIDLTRKNPAMLPLEFRLLDAEPGYWTPEIVISRHNGLYRNAAAEITLARAVRALGPKKLEDLLDLHPGNPSLEPAAGIDLTWISEAMLELYREARAPLLFAPEDLPTRNSITPVGPTPLHWIQFSDFGGDAAEIEGSNNWVVSGRLSRSGAPLLANDPHRVLQAPSLRYWVHLRAPGWNVIGAGEPALPGVSVGHNENGAWGQTTFSADQEDLQIYDTNPRRRNQYKYQGRWEDMRVIRERIPVKGGKSHQATLKFTRHGPVLFEDEAHHKALALRAAWLETGCAPYLASLRLDQAGSWEDFRRSVFTSRTPSLNFVWADRSGDIGWQMAGLTPVREGWPGLLPVPGDGRFEWQGFIPPPELPSRHNPDLGFIATANEDNLPAGYPYGVGYIWDAPFRVLRIGEVLGGRPAMNLADMTALQQDYLSIPARRLVPLLKNLSSEDALVKNCLAVLKNWDFVLSPDSAAAAVYVAWQRALLNALNARLFPPEFSGYLPGRSLPKLIGWLETADPRLTPDGPASRDKLLMESLRQAALFLEKIFGPAPGRWRYGDERFHHVLIRHPMSAAVGAETRRSLDLGPLRRGGSAQTVNMTSDVDNQASGATFRFVVDLWDWDLAVGTNSPGQSGDRASPHYSDLFVPWAEGRYFPVCFSPARIAAEAESVILLEPRAR
jgi:penicillin G amidase